MVPGDGVKGPKKNSSWRRNQRGKMRQNARIRSFQQEKMVPRLRPQGPFIETEMSDQELTEARNFKDFLDIFAYIDHMEILFPGKTLVHYHHDSKTGR